MEGRGVPSVLGYDNGNEKRIFLCRMNVSRNARRQMRFGDQKVTIYLHYRAAVEMGRGVRQSFEIGNGNEKKRKEADEGRRSKGTHLFRIQGRRKWVRGYLKVLDMATVTRRGSAAKKH